MRFQQDPCKCYISYNLEKNDLLEFRRCVFCVRISATSIGTLTEEYLFNCCGISALTSTPFGYNAISFKLNYRKVDPSVTIVKTEGWDTPKWLTKSCSMIPKCQSTNLMNSSSKKASFANAKGVGTIVAGSAMAAPLFDLANFFLGCFSHLSYSFSESRTLYILTVLNFFLHAHIPCLCTDRGGAHSQTIRFTLGYFTVIVR